MSHSFTVFALWYGTILSAVTVILGLTFAVLYQVKTGGAWRRTEIGRHLMAFVLAPASVLLLALIRALFGADLDTLWFLGLRMIAFTSVPLVYAQRIWIFLKTQKEKDSVPGKDH
jgi:cytochrome bd-type quinol oxidase subunit 2